MSLSRKWIFSTDIGLSADTAVAIPYVRYDAGSWFAEQIGEDIQSYTVLTRCKISEQEWVEELQLHEVPRLPHLSYSVESYSCRLLSTGGFQLPHWTVESEVSVLSSPPPVVSPEPPLPPLHREGGDTRGTPGGRTVPLSSGRTSRVPPQRVYPMSPEVPPQSRNSGRHAAPGRPGSVPIEHWTPLQPPEILSGQPQGPAVSSGHPRERQTYSPRTQGRPLRRGPSRPSNAVDGQSYQPESSACQIRE